MKNHAEPAVSQANLSSRCLTGSQNHSEPNKGVASPRTKRKGQAARSQRPAARVLNWSRKEEATQS